MPWLEVSHMSTHDCKGSWGMWDCTDRKGNGFGERPANLCHRPQSSLFCVDFWLLCPPPLLPWAKSGSSLARPLFVGGLPCSSSSMSSQFSRLCCCFRSCLFWQISWVLAPMLCWLGSHRSGFEHICCSVQCCFSQQELCHMRLFQQRQSDVRGLSWGLWASSSKLGVPWGTCVAVPIVLWLGTLAGSRDLSSWWVLFS